MDQVRPLPRRSTRILVAIALLVCVLLDTFTPLSIGGAFHLKPSGRWVEMDGSAPLVGDHALTVEDSAVETAASIVPVFLPDWPPSARTPAARPPPSS